MLIRPLYPRACLDGVWWVTPEQSGGAFNASFLMFSHKVLGCYFSQLPHSSWSQLYTPSLFGQLFSTEVSETFLKFCFLLTVSLQVWLHAASTNLVQSDIFCHLSQSPLNLAFHKGLEEAHLEVTSCSSVTQTTTMWKLKSLAFTAQSLEFRVLVSEHPSVSPDKLCLYTVFSDHY